MRVPTKNVLLTVDGVATRLAIRELKRAKIDSQPQLFSHEVRAGIQITSYISRLYGRVQDADLPLPFL
jgi:hypothetical protein